MHVGYTDFTEDEVKRIVMEIGKDFRGGKYHLMNKNCNHFSGGLTQVITHYYSSNLAVFIHITSCFAIFV